MKYEISQEQMNNLSAILADTPMKYGVPIANILNQAVKVEPDVVPDSKEKK